ncbi:MAG TPA: hypothetical protein VLI39_21040 [Sedimentisphaerales bacterium]|nr:hypothetical protein [Sedimentisphaerales bacterium]
MFERALSFYTRYFAIWVFLGGLAAYRWPAPFKSSASWYLWFFALTMFGIGAVLRIEDFRRIAMNPDIVLALKHFGAEATIPTTAFVFVCILTASIAASIRQRGAVAPAE